MSKSNNGTGGIIAGVSSFAGVDTLPDVPIYTATKHAVIGFMKAIGVC